MKTKTKLLSLFLALTLLLSLPVLTSCDLSGNKTAELEETLKSYVDEKVNASSDVNNYDINITSDSTVSLLAASKGLLSTVSVYCNFVIKRSYGWGPNASTYEQQTQSAGSGVIYRLDKKNGDAYIITNYHVVYNSQASTKNHISDEINLYLYGKESSAYAIPATYVGGSMLYDIAVLKVENSDVLRASNARAADFEDSNEVSVLDTAIVIGNPEAKGISATVGHVNVQSEYIQMTAADDTTPIEMRVMRIDAAVNSGNSGGGLFNDKGELIGIVNAKMSSSSIDNIGYAIPSNIAKYVADNILYYCDGKENESVYRCLLGITVAAASSDTVYDTGTGKVHIVESVAVKEVGSTSPALNVLKAGDVIRSITIGEKTYEVTRIFHIVDIMLNARVGDTVTIAVVRDGTEQSVSLTIKESSLTKCS